MMSKYEVITGTLSINKGVNAIVLRCSFRNETTYGLCDLEMIFTYITQC